MPQNPLHTVHIPVMGTGFTIDTPIKVARYGINSVISLVDDALIEEMRKYYCRLTGEEYVPIPKDDADHRAKRITAYLNLMDKIVKEQFRELRASAFEIGSEITKYFNLLPDSSPLKQLYLRMLSTQDQAEKDKIQAALRESIKPGEIQVNIMTKLDRPNFDKDDKELPPEFSDALAALRGFAQSSLNAAIVFSAGFNRRLYSYVEEFKDFFADANGFIQKKIIVKVSDYRSALIQGKFFAKKGIWVSEYRIESGLNCGGHAFATDGFLMGPILEEFRIKRVELIKGLHEMCNEALRLKNLITLEHAPEVKITAQGGIGTAKEQNFLMDHYELAATGWGSPFLLVPEATNVEDATLKRLAAAKENDIYLSEVSPLGVPFNNLRGSLSDEERDHKILKGRPGSACPKGYLVSNTEFTPKPICTASRLYQKRKIDQLASLKLGEEEYGERFKAIVVKSCICHDLGGGAILKNKIEVPQKYFTAVCPGPNIAYFSKIATLEEMIGHIYGRLNLIEGVERPHMFLKELKLYIDYLVKEVRKAIPDPEAKQKQYFIEFRQNLLDGIAYYAALFPQIANETAEFRAQMMEELKALSVKLEDFAQENGHIFFKALHPSAA